MHFVQWCVALKRCLSRESKLQKTFGLHKNNVRELTIIMIWWIELGTWLLIQCQEIMELAQKGCLISQKVTDGLQVERENMHTIILWRKSFPKANHKILEIGTYTLQNKEISLYNSSYSTTCGMLWSLSTTSWTFQKRIAPLGFGHVISD